jgi:hypothetical protein
LHSGGLARLRRGSARIGVLGAGVGCGSYAATMPNAGDHKDLLDLHSKPAVLEAQRAADAAWAAVEDYRKRVDAQEGRCGAAAARGAPGAASLDR